MTMTDMKINHALNARRNIIFLKNQPKEANNAESVD